MYITHKSNSHQQQTLILVDTQLRLQLENYNPSNRYSTQVVFVCNPTKQSFEPTQDVWVTIDESDQYSVYMQSIYGVSILSSITHCSVHCV